MNGKRSWCRCVKSKCLKLYCECFAALKLCDGCTCKGCENETDTDRRQASISMVLSKNPSAFDKEKKVLDGCHCKKSACLRKYCECFAAETFCGSQCKCVDCCNWMGSEHMTTAHLAKFRPGASEPQQLGSRDADARMPESTDASNEELELELLSS